MNVSLVLPDENVIVEGLKVNPAPVGVTVKPVSGASDKVIVRLVVVLPACVVGKAGGVIDP